MTKSKKNLITLVAAVVVVGALVGLYLWQNQRRQQAEAEATPSPTPAASITLIDRAESDIASVAFTANGKSFTLAATYGEAEEATWQLVGDPEIAINQTTAKDMVRGLYYLSVVEKLFDQVDNPADYGIGPDAATAVATYTDGSHATVRVGKMTPARDRYYMMLEGDPALYLFYSYYGDRYYNDVGALIDRTLPTITSESIQYIYLKERGKAPIEFGFFGTDQEKQDMYEQFGMIYVTMLQPYPGRELYYSNFEQSVMTDFMNMQIGDMVALRPDDLSIYGLDDPSLELWINDLESEIHLLFGEQTGDGKIYCKFYDRPQVFLTDYEYVKRMYNINVFTFIEKFVALVNIVECNGIDIEVPGNPERNYHVTLDHIVLPPEEDEEEGEAIINPYINGQLVQELAFKTFYQRLIAISYDTEIEAYAPESEPIFTVTFHLIDKDPVVLRYYTFDNNFYAVQRDDNPIQFVSSRQNSEIMFQAMVDLLAGKLDREY